MRDCPFCGKRLAKYEDEHNLKTERICSICLVSWQHILYEWEKDGIYTWKETYKERVPEGVLLVRYENRL